MYINATGYYVPSGRVDNDHFLEINGLTSEWIVQRTGIRTRSIVGEGEGSDSMGLAAIDNALASLPYPITDIDLIVSACYSPYDTVATLAHVAQQKYNIDGAKAVYCSSACSSFVNGLEIVEGYFAMGKATKALLICSEHNTYYRNESDPKCGHLWGDAAVAYFISKEPVADTDMTIHGISMPYGKDVFLRACNYMIHALEQVTKPFGMAVTDISYIICHQANKRIVANVAHQLELPDDRFINNIEELGNTGSASAALVLAQNRDNYPKGTTFGLTVFGGGYSCGAFLVEK